MDVVDKVRTGLKKGTMIEDEIKKREILSMIEVEIREEGICKKFMKGKYLKKEENWYRRKEEVDLNRLLV